VEQVRYVLDYSIRGPLAPSISPGFYDWNDRGGTVCAMHGLGFTLHRAPWCTSDEFQPPCWSPLASGRRFTTLSSWLVTRHATGVTKPVDRLQLTTAAPPTLSPVPTSVRSALADPH
jgi:hypothetical protein